MIELHNHKYYKSIKNYDKEPLESEKDFIESTYYGGTVWKIDYKGKITTIPIGFLLNQLASRQVVNPWSKIYEMPWGEIYVEYETADVCGHDPEWHCDRYENYATYLNMVTLYDHEKEQNDCGT